MSAPRFFVESVDEPEVHLSPADARHALRSLRLRSGDPVTLADGRGAVAAGRIVSATDGKTLVAVESRRSVARASPLVSVALSPPKGDRLGWGIQKLAELGVDEVVLIRTERSVRSWDADRLGRAVDRLRGVAREAAMQSRQPFVMELRAGETLRDVLTTETAQAVVLSESGGEPLGRVLTQEPRQVLLVVGPEGGFSEEELAHGRRAGATMATLGPNVLRTETAAIVGAALVLAHYGRLG
jgi:16S rRNA (uracil1498-N3)-methyltransferase